MEVEKKQTPPFIEQKLACTVYTYTLWDTEVVTICTMKPLQQAKFVFTSQFLRRPCSQILSNLFPGNFISPAVLVSL